MNETDSRLGLLKTWHNPHNSDCPHNEDIAADCTCKLSIARTEKPKRKPRIVFRVCDHSVNHGTKPELVAELHDDGKLIIRESGRRTTYETTLGKVYAREVRSHAFQVASEHARTRAAARKSAKQAKRLARRLKV